jgi:hypothetical protein
VVGPIGERSLIDTPTRAEGITDVNESRITLKLAVHAGHLAVWLGLYFTSVYVAGVLVLGRRASMTAVLACFCAGIGLYLLDRVKARDAWLDPADGIAQPERFQFLLARRTPVRVVAWIALLCGTLAAASIDLRNLLLPPIGIGGVLLYSSVRGRGARLKDVLVIKNLLPGLAIGSLAVVFAWQSPPLFTTTLSMWWTAVVLVGLVLMVTADAMLCDLDDAATDAAHRTRTMPTALGPRATWIAALALHVVAGGAVMWAGAAIGTRSSAGFIAVGNGVVTLGLFQTKPAKVRDLVDLKLPVVVALAWAIA